MSVVLERRFRGALPWVVSLLVVLLVHSSALLLLNRTIPLMGPEAPQPILMDLAPEPAAPADAAPPAPPPPEPTPPQPAPPTPAPPPPPTPPEPEPPPPEPPPPEPPPPEVPPDVTPPVPDVALPVPQAEVPLPPVAPPKPRPPPRPRPAVVRPAAPSPTASAPPAAASPIAAPPGPVAAAPPPGQVVSSWEGRVVAHLAQYKRFPPAAQRRGEEGVVMMRMSLSRSGQVLSMAVAHGSGYADLDAEAQAWISRAVPLPAFPPEMTAERQDVVVPLRFSLSH